MRAGDRCGVGQCGRSPRGGCGPRSPGLFRRRWTHGAGARPLELARQNIAASDVATRVTVRKQDVAGFTDDTGFDLAYLPAPFVPRPALQAGPPRIAAPLRPAAGCSRDTASSAVPRLRTPSPGSKRSSTAARR
jgi:hypothetical protein